MPYPVALEYDIAAFEAAVIFVVVDGGCTRVDAVFTFGRNGFNIDSAGIKCLSDGWTLVRPAGFKDVSSATAFSWWSFVDVEILKAFCFPKLTAVARSLPPPTNHKWSHL